MMMGGVYHRHQEGLLLLLLDLQPAEPPSCGEGPLSGCRSLPAL